MKLVRYFTEITLKRGQYLYKEGEKSDDIYFLMDGELDLTKSFKVQTTPQGAYVFFEGMNSKDVPIEQSIKSKVIKNVVTLAKCQPHQIVGTMEVMLNAKERFKSAVVSSKSATMFKLKKSNLQKISNIDSKQIKIKGNTIENSLTKIAMDRMQMVNRRIQVKF